MSEKKFITLCAKESGDEIRIRADQVGSYGPHEEGSYLNISGYRSSESFRETPCQIDYMLTAAGYKIDLPWSERGDGFDVGST